MTNTQVFASPNPDAENKHGSYQNSNDKPVKPDPEEPYTPTEPDEPDVQPDIIGEK